MMKRKLFLKGYLSLRSLMSSQEMDMPDLDPDDMDAMFDDPDYMYYGAR
jgi:hypothetical protein